MQVPFLTRPSRSTQFRPGLASALVAMFSAMPFVTAHAVPPVDSRPYYFNFSVSEPVARAMGITSTRSFNEVTPWLRMTGGGAVTCCSDIWVSDQGFRASPIEVGFFNSSTGYMEVASYRDGSCRGQILAPVVPVLGTKQSTQTRWTIDPYTFYTIDTGESPWCNEFSFGLQWFRPITIDELSFSLPKRRKALDGGEYDASEVAHLKNGVPWYTYSYGYHLGLTAIESNWDEANRERAGDIANMFRVPSPRNNFELSSLPPPWVEEDVVEYVNRVQFPAQPDGQYFYTAIAADKAILDSYPDIWQRTGRSFKSGGYVGTCRFYAGRNGGPNTHFYTADAKECEALKKIEFLDYEGSSFTVNMPLPGATVAGIKPCPIDSKPLFRLYNNATHSDGRFVSNHRYTTDRTDVAAFVAKGWVDEGQVMCVPI